MIEFDRYVPATWLDEGLAVPAPERSDEEAATRAPIRGFRMLRSTLTASVVAVGMALTDVPFVALGIGVAAEIQVTEPLSQPSAESDVPPGYWPKLVTLLRNAPQLPADDTSKDPDPLG